MKAKKVLFVTQEITPYVPESELSLAGRKLPQQIQEQGCEIRTFMPRWGNINERRNQLHEVIRLSGMNIIIDDTDNPLIIKVASLQPARMQVYFIDNDDFFRRRGMRVDENGCEHADNVSRAIFYARGVLETVKRTNWVPDVVHCQGWMSSIVPLYLKTAYNEEPSFVNSKVVFSSFKEQLTSPMPENLLNALKFRGANEEVFASCGVDFTKPEALMQLAVKYSDGFIQTSPDEELANFAKSLSKPVLDAAADDIEPAKYTDFYESLF